MTAIHIACSTLELLGIGTILCLAVHEADLIAFEQRTTRKLRAAANRLTYRIYWTVQDVKAIRRACRRQGITFRGFIVLLWQERKERRNEKNRQTAQ